jgi:hypothetical protein
MVTFFINLFPLCHFFQFFYCGDALRHAPCALLYLGNLEAGWRNRWTLTERAPAWSAQSTPFSKDEPAIETGGRFHDEALRTDRSGDVVKVIQDFPFFDMEDL